MGYCMDMSEDQNFTIPKSQEGDALAAIHVLADQSWEHGTGGVWDGGRQTQSWYAFTDRVGMANAKTLDEAMVAWRWSLERGMDGSITGVIFTGEKKGDDQMLWDAIAPYVTEGSYIEMMGEDDARWRWTFKGGRCLEMYMA